jgi:hypothetical protein
MQASIIATPATQLLPRVAGESRCMDIQTLDQRIMGLNPRATD